MKDKVLFPGPCPFLMCYESGPHYHPVCPLCGALNYSNLYCNLCRFQHDIEPCVGQSDAVPPSNWEV